ncbi:hypothetical protein [Lactobacillus sp.]|uniref:hypothetical protein n=1 Tax=Lactobacillus sp. TaxID=1591 RepID=UPI00199E3854|nr:hypothetical protein [Lactobacillus sp.]MBD5429679.1 hypothetical protein [Lactobacillus sp.]
MKHKLLTKLLITASLASGIGVTATTTTHHSPDTVEAATNWYAPRTVKLTKNVHIYKIKMAKHVYQTQFIRQGKDLKKGTVIKTVSGGMQFGWFLIKNGYTHSGLSLYSRDYRTKTSGYAWVIGKIYSDTKWFKVIK